MAEPVSTAATGAGAVGVMALLIGAFGPVAADVMLVVISALAGCFIALSSMRNISIMQSIGFVVIGVTVSLVLSWGVTSAVINFVPSISGPYTPSIIAMFIGFMSNRLPVIFNQIIKKVEGKFGIDEPAAK